MAIWNIKLMVIIKYYKYIQKNVYKKTGVNDFLSRRQKAQTINKNSLYYSLLKNHLTLYHEDSKR